jgi:hypothetical protein
MTHLGMALRHASKLIKVAPLIVIGNSSNPPIQTPTRKVGVERKKLTLGAPLLGHQLYGGTQIAPSGPFSCGWSEEAPIRRCDRSSLPPPHGTPRADGPSPPP